MNDKIYPEIPVLERASLALASASPRRRELLGRLVPSFHLIAADIDETVQLGEVPLAYVRRLALEKAEAGARLWATTSPATGERLIIGADTTVVLGDRLLGKPTSKEEAVWMLAQLSGQTHQVVTGVAVLLLTDQQILLRRESLTVATEVEFQPLRRAEIEWYVATGEPMDKAGAYAIQGYGGALIANIRGDYYNVVGLPLAPLINLLRAF
ncbi:MAG: Maf family protein [Chloroflexota bacterium]